MPKCDFIIKLLCNFIEITLRLWCSLVNLLNIFRATFYKNTYGGLLLNNAISACYAKYLFNLLLIYVS